MIDRAPDPDVQIEALTLILRAIREQRTMRSGYGEVECPHCHQRLHYSFQRFPKRARSLDYTVVCETAGCIRFAGH